MNCATSRGTAVWKEGVYQWGVKAVYSLKLCWTAPASFRDFDPVFVGRLLDAGTNNVSFQNWVGPADPTSAGRYHHCGRKIKDEATSPLQLPYRRRASEMDRIWRFEKDGSTGCWKG